MKTEELKTFADRLRWARGKAKVSQTSAAKHVGITQPSYSELETGQSQSSTHTPKFAQLYGVDAVWLSTGEGTPESTGAKLKFMIDQLPEHEQQMVSEIVRRAYEQRPKK